MTRCAAVRKYLTWGGAINYSPKSNIDFFSFDIIPCFFFFTCQCLDWNYCMYCLSTLRNHFNRFARLNIV